MKLVVLSNDENSKVLITFFRNYTSSSKAINASEIVPLLDEPSTPTASTSATKKLSMNNSKVAPIISKATLISKSNTQAASVKPSALGFKPYTVSSVPSASKASVAASKPANLVLLKDSKKNEEKLKQKAEKEAKKVNKIDVLVAPYKINLSLFQIRRKNDLRRKKKSWQNYEQRKRKNEENLNPKRFSFQIPNYLLSKVSRNVSFSFHQQFMITAKLQKTSFETRRFPFISLPFSSDISSRPSICFTFLGDIVRSSFKISDSNKRVKNQRKKLQLN